MQSVSRYGWLAIGGLLASGCSRTPPAPPPFTIARTAPVLGVEAPPLLLNDAVTVYFDAPVSPVSVTADSVTMMDDRGQQVPGSLRVGPDWVTFQPQPPLAPDLGDGSFRPGGRYQLMIAGSPRPDAVRAADGRRLAAATVFPLRAAALHERPAGLPAPLRPIANDLPFLLRPNELPQQLPADAPRLHLHFTQPLLPASVTPAAFEITLIDGRPPFEELVPRHVRVVNARNEPPGCTVEIELGARPARTDGRHAPLRADTQVCVQLRRGAVSVLDYSGAPPLPTTPPLWSVIAGDRVALAEWPVPGDVVEADADLAPTFEENGGMLRPRVRVEAGDGSLGVFRPRGDTTLRPGEPFDRGDGELVVSRGSDFPFLAIDVPAGVTVRVDATGAPVVLRACGGVRLEGTLLIDAPSERLPAQRALPVGELVAHAPATVLAAGDLELRGAIRTVVPPTGDGTSLLLASAGSIDLRALDGELPFQTMLAYDAGGGLRGLRGQGLVFGATFTYGVAPGADYAVRGTLPWRQLPLDRDGGVVHLVDRSPELQVAWQSAPADPVRKNEPDRTVGRVSRLQPAGDRDTIAVTAGAFVRFALSTRVTSDRELPRLRELRLCDR